MKRFEHLRAVLLLQSRDEITAISEACRENHDSPNLLTFTHLDDAVYALQALQEARLTPDILLSEDRFVSGLFNFLRDETGFAHMYLYLFTDESREDEDMSSQILHSQDEETPLNNLQVRTLSRPKDLENYATCMRTLKSQTGLL